MDEARHRDRAKRGGKAIHPSLVEAAAVATPERAEILALDEALHELKSLR